MVATLSGIDLLPTKHLANGMHCVFKYIWLNVIAVWIYAVVSGPSARASCTNGAHARKSPTYFTFVHRMSCCSNAEKLRSKY
ncbi:hypothetical protein SFRURICE_002458 [Spodoptera frugiperda]|nr:hypothetical protein SFRURICE_002458 [Spodoptera frugiperda]